jgi:hypothetical protein
MLETEASFQIHFFPVIVIVFINKLPMGCLFKRKIPRVIETAKEKYKSGKEINVWVKLF